MLDPKTGKFTSKDLTRERWLRGRLNYKLHDGQHLIEQHVSASKHQLFVGELARQFGKTFWLAKKALEKAFQTPKAKVKYGTAFQTDLLEFILPAFDIVMEDCPENLKPVWKSQRSKFVLPHNDSEIKMIGLDRKPNGMRGTVPDLMILDEAGFMARLNYLYRSVIVPATTHRPDCKILVFSTPPDTPDHEFLDYVQKAELEGGYCKFTIYDNPLVNQATIDRLMKESGGAESTTWRREYLCEHITDQNLAVIPEWSDLYWREHPKDPRWNFYHKYVSMDLGVRDNTAAIFGYYDFNHAALIIEDEYVISGPKMTTKLLSDDIKAKEKQLWGDAKIYRKISDSNNPLLLQDLSILHQLHFTATNKGTLEEMVNTIRMAVRNGQIIVHPRCKQLRGCLKYGIWDKHRNKFSRSNIYGHYDALAALIYLVRNLDRSTNPVPSDFMMDVDNQILFNRKIETENSKALKKVFQL